MELRSANPVDVDAIAGLHASSWRRIHTGTLIPTYLEGEIADDPFALWTRRLTAPPDARHAIVGG